MTNVGIAENKDLVAQHVCRAFTTKYSGTCNGKQEAIVKVLGPLTPQLDGLTITPDNTIAEGDYLVVQGEEPRPGEFWRDLNDQYCQIFRIAKGKVRKFPRISGH